MVITAYLLHLSKNLALLDTDYLLQNNLPPVLYKNGKEERQSIISDQATARGLEISEFPAC